MLQVQSPLNESEEGRDRGEGMERTSSHLRAFLRPQGETGRRPSKRHEVHQDHKGNQEQKWVSMNLSLRRSS